MVLTINPAVSGARTLRHTIHVAAYIVGLFAGAVTTLGVSYVLGRLIIDTLSSTVAAGVAATAVSLVVARDLGARVAAPYIERQVPEWLRGIVPAGVVAVVFGYILGLGFVTRYTYSAHMAMVVVAPLLEPAEFLLVAAVFALAKGVNVITGPTAVSIAGLGAAFDRSAFFRRYGTQTLRAANTIVAATVLTSLLT